MDVHIHRTGPDLQPDHAGRIAAGQQGVFIGLFQRALQQRGADEAAVAVEKLRAAVSPSGGRGGDEAREPDVAVRTAQRQEGRGQIPAQQGIDTGVGSAVAGCKELFLSVPQKAHRDIGPAQGTAQPGLDAGGGLAPVAFQEFQPGRGVVEQIPDADGSARRAADGLHLLNIAGLQRHPGALGILGPARQQLDARHRRNGRQRLAAKAHGGDGLEAVLVSEL